MNKGGRSLFNAELVGRDHVLFGADFDVYIEREATLNDALTEIESRRLRDIKIVFREGYPDESAFRLGREKTSELVDALLKALRATVDDESGGAS